MRLSIQHLSLLHIAAAGLLLLSCGEDTLVDNTQNEPVIRVPETSKPLLFVVSQHNTSRAVSLPQAGFLNFGVFGLVDQDVAHPVMHNYLVGYYDEEYGYGAKTGSTFGDPAQSAGVSYWMYEGMGSKEYTGTFAGKPITDQHRSNIATQSLYSWNSDSHVTSIYAYAPYAHGSKAVDFDYVNHRLIYPEGLLVDGYNDDGVSHEYLFASSVVDSCNYGNDVNLRFRRLNCKVSVSFYEEIEGYSVEVLKVEGRPDGAGAYYRSAGATVSFSDSVLISLDTPLPHSSNEPLRFAAPDTSAIGTTRDLSTSSPTIYYGLPKPVTTGGISFDVTFRLTSEKDGSQIMMTDVKAFVPAEKCCWKSNVFYTYIFKIANKGNQKDPSISLDGYIKEEEGESPLPDDPDDPRIPICN